MAEKSSATIARSRIMTRRETPFLPPLFANARSNEMAAYPHAIAFATTRNLERKNRELFQ